MNEDIIINICDLKLIYWLVVIIIIAQAWSGINGSK